MPTFGVVVTVAAVSCQPRGADIVRITGSKVSMLNKHVQ